MNFDRFPFVLEPVIQIHDIIFGIGKGDGDRFGFQRALERGVVAVDLHPVQLGRTVVYADLERFIFFYFFEIRRLKHLYNFLRRIGLTVFDLHDKIGIADIGNRKRERERRCLKLHFQRHALVGRQIVGCKDHLRSVRAVLDLIIFRLPDRRTRNGGIPVHHHKIERNVFEQRSRVCGRSQFELVHRSRFSRDLDFQGLPANALCRNERHRTACDRVPERIRSVVPYRAAVDTAVRAERRIDRAVLLPIVHDRIIACIQIGGQTDFCRKIDPRASALRLVGVRIRIQRSAALFEHGRNALDLPYGIYL